MSDELKERLLEHVGHNVAIVIYGNENVALECEDCCMVLTDYNLGDNNDE